MASQEIIKMKAAQVEEIKSKIESASETPLPSQYMGAKRKNAIGLFSAASFW